jgi:hypothetical protein
MTEKSEKTKKKSRPRGRPPLHGGFSLLVRKGELPENRQYIARWLTEVREGLIEDLGPSEEDLPTAQRVLIDRIISKLGVIRCIEEHIRENSVMTGHNLAPSLRASYLAYNNSVRLDLQALGIDTRKADEAGDLSKYIELQDSKKRGENNG